MPTNKERWKNDPEYRKQVIKDLEKEGKINRLSEREFGRLVHDEF